MDDEVVGKGAKRNHISAQALTPEIAVVKVVDTILPALADPGPGEHRAAVAHRFQPTGMLGIPLLAGNVGAVGGPRHR